MFNKATSQQLFKNINLDNSVELIQLFLKWP